MANDHDADDLPGAKRSGNDHDADDLPPARPGMKIPRTGLFKVREGQRVITAAKVRQQERKSKGR